MLPPSLLLNCHLQVVVEVRCSCVVVVFVTVKGMVLPLSVLTKIVNGSCGCCGVGGCVRACLVGGC